MFSTNPTGVESTIFLLTSAHELKALPRVREIATTGTGDARAEAIRFLGFYGHPQDYDFLVTGLRSDDKRT